MQSPTTAWPDSKKRRRRRRRYASKERRRLHSLAKRRNWSALPDLLLDSIVLHLSSPIDLLTFAAVCRSWRSFIRDNRHRILPAFPPLFLNPYSHNGYAYTFRTLDPNGPHRCFRTVLPSGLPLNCRLGFLGSSHGFLILADWLWVDRNDDKACTAKRRYWCRYWFPYQFLLANAFTGDKIRLPLIRARCPYKAALTAHPSAPHSVLIAFHKNRFLSFRLASRKSGDGGLRWSKHRLPYPACHVSSLICFQNRLLAVDLRANNLLDLGSANEEVFAMPAKIFKMGGIRESTGKGTSCWLIECAGDVLLLVLVPGDGWRGEYLELKAYRLDFEGKAWVPTDDVGNYALFVNGDGWSSSCYDPERWGGRRNCVYAAGAGLGMWREFPLDGTCLETDLDSLKEECLWVHLSFCF